jgi:uncharacterized membrane protein (UPF0127 family)
MLPILKYNSDEIAINVEISKTLISQMLGLMFRTHLPADYAMIFVMKKPSSVGIHMLFMCFPVDIIFLNEKKKIVGLADLKPWTGHRYMKNIKYVIETKSGAIERYKISIGGQMEFLDI